MVVADGVTDEGAAAAAGTEPVRSATSAAVRNTTALTPTRRRVRERSTEYGSASRNDMREGLQGIGRRGALVQPYPSHRQGRRIP